MLKKYKKIVVGMSGGVDSSVSAWLLKEQGYNVIGLFMKNWDDSSADEECSASADFEDVRKVCNHIGIPYYTVNFEKEYQEKVFSYFLSEYSNGRTPNPDILCNREIKFGDFLRTAHELGANSIATGHYAQVFNKDGRKFLGKGQDTDKDQSYFLYAVPKDDLFKTHFPIGHLQKKEVRELARKTGISTSEKKDSTGICFIGKRKLRQFLSNYLPAQSGQIRSLDDKVLGEHHGLMYYTLGQRKGLGIGGGYGSGEPFFVVKKDLTANILYVTEGHDHPSLYSNGCIVIELNWLINKPTSPFACKGKCRYRQKDQEMMVIPRNDETCSVEFKDPQRAITPGQSIVFYDDDICLGGGIIK